MTDRATDTKSLLDLVDEHARDWMRVGQSGFGYVYDPSAPYDKKAALETTASLKKAIEANEQDQRDAARYRALRRNTGRETDISSGPGSPKLLVIRIDCEGCEHWLESGAPDFSATLDAALDDEIKRMGYDRK